MLAVRAVATIVPLSSMRQKAVLVPPPSTPRYMSVAPFSVRVDGDALHHAVDLAAGERVVGGEPGRQRAGERHELGRDHRGDGPECVRQPLWPRHEGLVDEDDVAGAEVTGQL